jgi:hypothetical protein
MLERGKLFVHSTCKNSGQMISHNFFEAVGERVICGQIFVTHFWTD